MVQIRLVSTPSIVQEGNRNWSIYFKLMQYSLLISFPTSTWSRESQLVSWYVNQCFRFCCMIWVMGVTLVQTKYQLYCCMYNSTVLAYVRHFMFKWCKHLAVLHTVVAKGLIWKLHNFVIVRNMSVHFLTFRKFYILRITLHLFVCVCSYRYWRSFLRCWSQDCHS